MTDVERSPARTSSWFAVGSGAVVVLSCGIWGWSSAVLSLVGMGALLAGLYRASREPLGVALACFTLAGITATALGAPIEVVLVAVVAAVLAWDTGERAVTLGEQLGRAAVTTRIEVVHAAATSLVGVCSVGVGYALYVETSPSYPLISVLALGCSVVVLLVTQWTVDR